MGDPMFSGRITSGKYMGNGSSMTIECGFEPARVKVYRIDNSYIIRHFKGLENSFGMGRVASGTNMSMRGITINVGGIEINESGFSVGNNISVNEGGVEYFWEVQ